MIGGLIFGVFGFVFKVFGSIFSSIKQLMNIIADKLNFLKKAVELDNNYEKYLKSYKTKLMKERKNNNEI